LASFIATPQDAMLLVRLVPATLNTAAGMSYLSDSTASVLM